MTRLNTFLVFLISSIAITGISIIDGKIWDIVFLIIGMIAYAIVGLLFSVGLLFGRKAGKDAYAFVFLLLILAGYGFYQLLVTTRNWILSWPLIIKIVIPSILMVGMTVALFFVIKKIIKTKKNQGTASTTES